MNYEIFTCFWFSGFLVAFSCVNVDFCDNKLTLFISINGISRSNVGELYFNANLLRTWSGSGSQSISNYEKIRTIGRGNFVSFLL